jgi:hypothetical protein
MPSISSYNWNASNSTIWQSPVTPNSQTRWKEKNNKRNLKERNILKAKGCQLWHSITEPYFKIKHNQCTHYLILLGKSQLTYSVSHLTVLHRFNKVFMKSPHNSMSGLQQYKRTPWQLSSSSYVNFCSFLQSPDNLVSHSRSYRRKVVARRILCCTLASCCSWN